MEIGEKFGVLGTGTVGQAIAARLNELRHDVFVGTRDPEKTLSRTSPDNYGNPPFKTWLDDHPEIEFGTFPGAATHGTIIVNATNGSGTLAALEEAGEENLSDKVLMDISNPLDFSQGFPPSLTVCNTDSLGEQIQRLFPNTRVVKTLNTVNAGLMVAPAQLADGHHTIFVSGNDPDAKSIVSDLLRSFGWKDILDLGDITTARGTEMYLPLWTRLYRATGSPSFSIRVVR